MQLFIIGLFAAYWLSKARDEVTDKKLSLQQQIQLQHGAYVELRENRHEEKGATLRLKKELLQ